jgi:hypothetical protein
MKENASKLAAQISMTKEVASNIAALFANIIKSSDDAQAKLSSYGLTVCDSGNQERLHQVEYMYGNSICVPEKVEFVFVPVDVFSKFLLNVTCLNYFAPFMFRSKNDNGFYLGIEVESMAFRDLQAWGQKLWNIKENCEEMGFVFPTNEHWNFFKSSKDSSPIIKFNEHSFVQIQKVENSIASMEEFSNLYRMFDGDRHYIILNNDCDLMWNIKAGITDIVAEIIMEGFVKPTPSFIDEIRTFQENNPYVEKDGLSGKIIEIKCNENKFVLVSCERLAVLYKDWFRYLINSFNINIIFTTAKCSSYFILRDPSVAFAKFKAVNYQSRSVDALIRGSYKRAEECFKFKFVDLDYSVRCMCAYISRHYICENWALNHGQVRPFAYSCLLSQLQSSGSGKSRTSQLLSLVMDTLYISSKTQTGFPKECSLFEDFQNNLDVWIREKRSEEVVPISVIIVVILNFFNRFLYLCMKKRTSCFDLLTSDLLNQNDQAFIMDNFLKFFNVTTPAFGSLQSFISFGKKWEISNSEAFNNEDIFQIPFSEKVLSSHPLAKDFSFNELKDLLVESRNTRIEKMVGKLYSNLSETKRNEKEKELKAGLSTLPYSMIIFDEAQNLLSKYNKKDLYQARNHDKTILKIDLFRLVRRSFGVSPFNWKFIWGMFLSTNTKITNFITTANEEDPSIRMWEDTFLLPPLLMNCNFDVFAKKFYDKTYQIVNPIKYIYTLQRVIDIISCGRPLFFANFCNYEPDFKKFLVVEANMNMPWINNWSKLEGAFRNLYTLCKFKVSGTQTSDIDLSEGDESKLFNLIFNSEDIKFAVISASIGILKIPAGVDQSELVRNHMAWLVAADVQQEGGLEITYASEGFFNSVMAKILEQYTSAYQLPLSFLENSYSKTFFDTGQIGEIVCRFLFLLAILRTKIVFPAGVSQPQDSIFKNITSMFYPRRVSDFLQKFVSKEMVEIFLDFCDAFYCKSTNCIQNEKVFSESLIAFSYFHQCKSVKNPVEFTRAMLYRGCARITPNGHKGADFILPLVSGDDRLGNILVQVKFVTDHYQNSGYCELAEEVRDGLMRELLERFQQEDEINPANWEKGTLPNFIYTNEVFRTDIEKFNLDNVFGPRKSKKPWRNPQKRLKSGDESYDHEMNIEIPIESTSNPEQNSGLERKEPESNKDESQKVDKSFPSLRIFIAIREVTESISTIELDEFGPILLIETNGNHSFLEKIEREMISLITKKSRSSVPIQELQGQYFGPTKSRMSPDPINPIYYKKSIDNDEKKLKLHYFAGVGVRDSLQREYKNRPEFSLEFEKLEADESNSNLGPEFEKLEVN